MTGEGKSLFISLLLQGFGLFPILECLSRECQF